MSERSPRQAIRESGRKTCPVCGQASYSKDGIHPQCAARQADDLIKKKIREQQSKVAQETKPKDRSWNRWSKQCPNCRVQLHVRRKTCQCGHEFREN